MTLKISETTLQGVKVIEPRIFNDARGYFMETFQSEKYRQAGIDCTFVQDNFSHSSRGILRGLHYQIEQTQDKLVYVISGEIFDVAVDIRRGSPTFGQWYGTHLSAENHRQIFIPKGFAHGFCVVSETTDVIYKCSDVYAPEHERGILWSDPDLAIEWPISDAPSLSEKDIKYRCLKDVAESDLPVYPVVSPQEV